MKRDMDLVRDILLKTEEADGSLSLESFYTLDGSRNVVNYHIELLVANGFLDATLHGSWSSRVVAGTVDGLTWDGQDFLDAMRDERVWKAAKKVLLETVGSTTFDVMKSACSMVATSMVKSHLGV